MKRKGAWGILWVLVAALLAGCKEDDGGGEDVISDLYDAGDKYSSFSPTTVSPGESWSASCDVKNGGTGAAGAFVVDFYASLDATITASDYLLGSIILSSGVRAGKFADVDLVLSSFPAVPGGTYYVGWFIDAGNHVFEFDESNNTAYKAGYVLTVITRSDLAVTAVDAADGSYAMADGLSVYNSTYNNGPDACSSYSVDFYLSTDTVIDASDTWIGGSSRTSGLAVGSTDNDSNMVSWGGMTPGEYYVGMIVTCFDDYDTSDNTGYDTTPITITSDPGGDMYEQNDTPGTAYDLGTAPIFQYVYPTILPSGDEDWFQFYIPISGFYWICISLNPPLNADYDVYVYDGSVTLLYSSTTTGDGVTESIQQLIGHPQDTYYVQVVGKLPDDFSISTYVLYIEIW